MFDALEQKALAIAKTVPGLDVVCVDTEGQRPDGFLAAIAAHPADRLTFTYDAGPQDHAAYMHTGGTTGAPKIARSTHLAEVSQAWLIAGLSDIRPDDVMLAGLPLFHAAGVRITGTMIWAAGASVVLVGPMGFRNPEVVKRLWETVETYRVTALMAIATVYASLLHVPVGGRDISSLRLAASGAAPLPVEIIERFEATFGIVISEGYGLTEGCCMSARNPPGGVRKVGSVGFRIPYQALKPVIVDKAGRYVRDCAVDEVGVVEDDRLDRSRNFGRVAFETVRRHDVHHLGGNVVLVTKRDAAERVAEHVAEVALHDLRRAVGGRSFVELEHFATSARSDPAMR
ncbi:MAG: AMP-binding protein [Rhodospirillales bacterium]|nr:AMP-binding protein [Rhodospirillales bacterium]